MFLHWGFFKLKIKKMEIKYSEWRDSVKKIQEMLNIESNHIKNLINNNAPKKFIAQSKEMYNYYYKLKAKKYKQKYIIDATHTPTE